MVGITASKPTYLDKVVLLRATHIVEAVGFPRESLQKAIRLPGVPLRGVDKAANSQLRLAMWEPTN